MKKYEVLQKMHDLGIIAVIRGKNREEGIRFGRACVRGGVNILEITFTVPGALEVLKTLREEFGEKVLLGAGTVLDAPTARLAILEGAQFIVSPQFDVEVAQLCNLYTIPYTPGCITLTDMTTALRYGCDVLKVFPGSLTHPGYFKDVHGPLPQANLMPTGGVSLDNVQEWFANGAFAVGVGSQLVKGTEEEIIEKCGLFLDKIRECRS